MGLRHLFKRKQVDTEATRRDALLRTGRIGEGVILDVTTAADNSNDITHVFYSYNANGVEYESSQSLDDAQRQRQIDYYPGARITVRFDPRRPTNSVVV
jgi:hypothetical protein